MRPLGGIPPIEYLHNNRMLMSEDRGWPKGTEVGAESYKDTKETHKIVHSDGRKGSHHPITRTPKSIASQGWEIGRGRVKTLYDEERGGHDVIGGGEGREVKERKMSWWRGAREERISEDEIGGTRERRGEQCRREERPCHGH